MSQRGQPCEVCSSTRIYEADRFAYAVGDPQSLAAKLGYVWQRLCAQCLNTPSGQAWQQRHPRREVEEVVVK